MLSSELKKNTEDIHRQAEKVMARWLKRIRSLEDHVDFLNWLYAYYSPLEDRIRTQLTSDNFPDIERRSRAGTLLQDMEAAGVPLPAPEICRDLPDIDTYGRPWALFMSWKEAPWVAGSSQVFWLGSWVRKNVFPFSIPMEMRPPVCGSHSKICSTHLSHLPLRRISSSRPGQHS